MELQVITNFGTTKTVLADEVYDYDTESFKIMVVVGLYESVGPTIKVMNFNDLNLVVKHIYRGENVDVFTYEVEQ